LKEILRFRCGPIRPRKPADWYGDRCWPEKREDVQ
jgi:hypothetical protein